MLCSAMVYFGNVSKCWMYKIENYVFWITFNYDNFMMWNQSNWLDSPLSFYYSHLYFNRDGESIAVSYELYSVRIRRDDSSFSSNVLIQNRIEVRQREIFNMMDINCRFCVITVLDTTLCWYFSHSLSSNHMLVWVVSTDQAVEVVEWTSKM